MLLVGICAGPYGLNLLSPSVVLLLDPAIAMALAMLGVFVGLGIDRAALRADDPRRAGHASAASRSPRFVTRRRGRWSS